MGYGLRSKKQGNFPAGNITPSTSGACVVKNIEYANTPMARNYPVDAILHWDADVDTVEKAGFGHDFQSLVLGNQYQLQADGSTVNIGANMPVDTIDGEKWLRSCGAVTNLLTNSVFAGAVSGTPGTAPTGWTILAAGGTFTVNDSEVSFSGELVRHYFGQTVSVTTGVYTVSFDIVTSGGVIASSLCSAAIRFPSGTTLIIDIDGAVFAGSSLVPSGEHKFTCKYTVTTAGSAQIRFGLGTEGTATGSVTISNPQLTATAYPVPYVPTTAAGPVTQPATNATATNGAWFKLLDGSELWKALTGAPLTLATRVRMGVGSGDFASTGYPAFIHPKASGSGVLYSQLKNDGTSQISRSSDDATWIGTPYLVVNRGDVFDLVVQTNSMATQYRCGHIKRGQTSITWGGWSNFDGSFSPSTLYRLMLGFNSTHPIWFNKITAWRKQVSDTEILEAMA